MNILKIFTAIFVLAFLTIGVLNLPNTLKAWSSADYLLAITAVGVLSGFFVAVSE
jgi:hypothetical protein